KAAARAGVDISADLAARAPAPPAVAAPPERGPSADDVRAAADVSPEARQAMILNMVASLDARLSASHRDPEGWVRLIRSRMVLGQKAEAQDALRRALAALSDDPKARDAVAAGAADLGVSASAGK